MNAIDLFAGLGGYQPPTRASEAMHMLGNAVPPPAAQRVIEAFLEAA